MTIFEGDVIIKDFASPAICYMHDGNLPDGSKATTFMRLGPLQEVKEYVLDFQQKVRDGYAKTPAFLHPALDAMIKDIRVLELTPDRYSEEDVALIVHATGYLGKILHKEDAIDI